MNNKTLMKKLVGLYFKPFKTKEDILEIETKAGVLQRAFGVKDYEIDNPIKDFEREVVLSNDEIKAELNKVLEWITYAKENNNYGDVNMYKNRAYYFVEAVNFFNANLASELKNQCSFKRI